MKGDRAYVEFGDFYETNIIVNPFQKKAKKKVLDLNTSFKGNEYTKLLMSNGQDKVFMFDAGRKTFFEFNSNSTIFYEPVSYEFNKDLCGIRDCIYKFDTLENIYYLVNGKWVSK